MYGACAESDEGPTPGDGRAGNTCQKHARRFGNMPSIRFCLGGRREDRSGTLDRGRPEYMYLVFILA